MTPLWGVTLKLVSVGLFAVMTALIKAMAAYIPTGELMFFRSFFAIPVILIWIGWRGQLRAGLRMAVPLRHLARGLIGTLAMGAGFVALRSLPLPEATAIGYAAPLLTVVFAALFLGEDVRVFRLSMVALGLAGVLIILVPRFGGGLAEAQGIGALAALFKAVCVAGAQVLSARMVRAGEQIPAIVFWFALVAVLVSLGTIPFGWVRPTPGALAVLVLIGLIGGVAQICLTSAYRFAGASVVAPFDYLSMIFALAIGYWIFAEVPGWPMLGGAALIITAGVLIIWRERRLARRGWR